MPGILTVRHVSVRWVSHERIHRALVPSRAVALRQRSGPPASRRASGLSRTRSPARPRLVVLFVAVGSASSEDRERGRCEHWTGVAGRERLGADVPDAWRSRNRSGAACSGGVDGGAPGTIALRVASTSMLPTLRVGQMITVDPRAYRNRRPSIGDVVVFHPPRGADSFSPKCGVAQEGIGRPRVCGAA